MFPLLSAIMTAEEVATVEEGVVWEHDVVGKKLDIDIWVGLLGLCNQFGIGSNLGNLPIDNEQAMVAMNRCCFGA